MIKATKKFHELQLLMMSKGLKSDVIVHPKGFVSMITYSLSGKLEKMFFSDKESDMEKIDLLIETYKTGE